MVPVRMVEMPVDEIVNVIPMRYGLVPASWTMHMSRLVSGAGMLRRADILVFRRDFDRMLVDMPGMMMVQMAVMKVIDVIAVFYSRMPATGTMLVRVINVMRKFAVAHGVLLI
jgi:hypothetical protein